MFRDIPGCSGMFRNVLCSVFYRRPTYTSSRTKRKRFYRKSGFQMFFVDFRSPYWCTKVVHQHGDSIQSSIKLRETFWQMNSETVCSTDLRLREIFYVLVFYNISFSWLFSLNGLEFIFYGVTVKTIYKLIRLRARSK